MIIENVLTGELKYSIRKLPLEGWKQTSYIIGSEPLFRDRIITLELTEGQFTYLQAVTEEEATYSPMLSIPIIEKVIERLRTILR